ncbi:Rtp1p [Sporobolomyces koalae]|uniref:Rtp1p n=1 Tax=Sporobolomyces koalae TaxID=500713 RepID=UPI00317C444F
MQLNDALGAISILVGASNSIERSSRRTKLGAPKPTLASILAERLHDLELAYPATDVHHVSSESDCERSTGMAAVRLLTLVHRSLPVPADASGPSTVQPVPVFSMTQIKHLQMASGIVAKWALAYRLETHAQSRLTDVEDDERRHQQLAETVTHVLEIVTAAGPKNSPRDQLRQVVLPQLALALIDALVHLVTLERLRWAPRLDNLFEMIPLPTLISHLLQLVPKHPPQSQHRRYLTDCLSRLLLRRGGVRSLLIVVIGLEHLPGAQGGQEQINKLEMVLKLLRGATSTTTSVLDQLVEILDAATTAVVEQRRPRSSSTSLGSSPASVPPTSILAATCYLISHFLLSPTTKRHLLSVLHRPFKPPLDNPILMKGYHRQLEFGMTRFSILISNVPITLPGFFETLFLDSSEAPSGSDSKTLTLLFSLSSFFTTSQVQDMIEEHKPQPEPGKDKDDRNDDDFETFEQELDNLLYIFGKNVSLELTDNLSIPQVVTKISKVVEELEQGFKVRVGQEEGLVEWSLDETTRELQLRWKVDNKEEGTSIPDIRIPGSTSLSDDQEHSIADQLSKTLAFDPQVLTQWLKTCDRKELSATLFLRWLDELNVLQQQQMTRSITNPSNDNLLSEEETVRNAKKSIVRLQLVLKMVEELGSDILTDPNQIIAFVGNTLDVATRSSSTQDRHHPRPRVDPGFGLKDLKIVDLDSESDYPEERGETEDEREFGIDSGLEGASGQDEMVLTALTLLLAVLEANEDLSTSTNALLLSIDSRLRTLSESPSTHASALIPPLIREAQMVLQLREASMRFSSSSSSKQNRQQRESDDGMESSRKKYQEALKLLQDPLLPVRAQGLHLLKNLIAPPASTTKSSTTTSNSQDSQTLLKTDPALLPAILSIFLGALTEEDSFLYLNAVQGLSLLVDVFGRQVIGGLVVPYTGERSVNNPSATEIRPVGTGVQGQRELDKRLRVGEALIQVVQRAGEALATLHEILLPPLLLTLRQSSLPIPLRASAITILATMVETAPIAMLPVLGQLGEAMRQLLEIETVSFRVTKPASIVTPLDEDKMNDKKGKKKGSVLIEEITGDSDSDEEEEDFSVPDTRTKPSSQLRPEEMEDPLSTDSKHPSLRRAALLFLSLLVRTDIRQRYESIEQAQKHAMNDLGQDLEKGKLRMPQERNPISARFDRRATDSDRGRGGGFGERERERLKVTLGYIRETDQDELVRIEASQVLDELEEAGM